MTPSLRVRTSRRFALRLAAAGAAGLAAWGVVALWIAPALIRRAHAGTSIVFLSRLMPGRDRIPLDAYLVAWHALALRITLTLVLVATAAGLLWRFRDRLRVTASRLVSDVPISPAMSLAVAAWLGILFAVGDCLFWLVKRQVTGEFLAFTNVDAAWMAPVAMMTLFLGILAPVAGLALSLGRPVPLRWEAGGLAGLGVYGLTRSSMLGIHPWAGLVLAGGAAAFVGQRAGPRLAGFVRRTLAPMLCGLATLALCMTLGPLVRERYRLARLAPAAPGSPNVLLIILDTVRGENLGLYGYPRPTTPRLEELARHAVVFDRAVAPAPWTLPSHESILTGRLASELNTSWRIPLDRTFPTLAEELTARGYATAAFVANLEYATSATGLARGFLRYADFALSSLTIARSAWLTFQMGERIAPRFLGRLQLVRKYAPEVNAEMLRWIATARGRPYFVFLNYMDAHGPYEHYAGFTERFDSASSRDSTLGAAGHRIAITGRLRRMIDQYDGGIAFLDHHVGLLLDTLRARGLLENTLIIIAADHGEHLGDRGLYQHGNSLYWSLLHVPLLIVPPGGTTPLRVAQPILLSDIAATVMDVLDSGAAPRFPGRSLRRFWVGGTLSDAGGGRPVISVVAPNIWETIPGPANRGLMQSVVSGAFHYIHNGDGVEELYDLDADPWEEHDLSALPAMRTPLERLRHASIIGRRPRE